MLKAETFHKQCPKSRNILVTTSVHFSVTSSFPFDDPAQEAEGSIRLRRGINSQSGYLEVFHDGGWGRVCDTQWDHSDAHVVCKQEGEYF